MELSEKEEPVAESSPQQPITECRPATVIEEHRSKG